MLNQPLCSLTGRRDAISCHACFKVAFVRLIVWWFCHVLAGV